MWATDASSEAQTALAGGALGLTEGLKTEGILLRLSGDTVSWGSFVFRPSQQGIALICTHVNVGFGAVLTRLAGISSWPVFDR